MTPTKLLAGTVISVLAIAIGGVWFATEWAAWKLGFQAQLGVPWLDLFGYPVYPVWALFAWWYVYGAYAPHIFDRAGTIAAMGGVVGCGVAVAASLWRVRQAKHVTIYGSSRGATEHDVIQAKLFEPEGVFLGRLSNQYLRHNGPENVMTFAPARPGKGVGLVVPTLLAWTQSALIQDIKGENWQLTCGWRSPFSHCLLFNPTDPRSARYNPLLEVRKGPHEVRDLQNIADIPVPPEDALERRNHWKKTSHSLLGVIMHVSQGRLEGPLRIGRETGDPGQRLALFDIEGMRTKSFVLKCLSYRAICIAFSSNDERTAKRISDALGTATKPRAQRNYAGYRLTPKLSHVMVYNQETARAFLTPGEVMQLSPDDELVLVSSLPLIRAKKLKCYEDRNFIRRVLTVPNPGDGERYPDRPTPRPNDWGAQVAALALNSPRKPVRLEGRTKATVRLSAVQATSRPLRSLPSNRSTLSQRLISPPMLYCKLDRPR